MAYIFDGVNKLIILSTGTTLVDAKDLYSRWKEWLLLSDNSKYLPALSVLGGDPLPGDRFLGTTYFLENGWKIRPYEGNHTLVLTGNLFSRDGSDPFVNTLGSFNVRIVLTVSNLVDTVTTGGGVGSVSQVADAVWNASSANYLAVGTTGAKLAAAGSAGDPWTTDITLYNTAGTAGKILNDTYAATQNLAIGSSSTNEPATGFTLVTGVVSSGTFTDTRSADAGQHTLSSLANLFDVNYTFNIGVEATPSSVFISAAVTNHQQVMSVYAWNNSGTPAWEKIGELVGGSQTTDFINSVFVLYTDHVDSNGNISIRFHRPGNASAIAINIDQLYVSHAHYISKTSIAEAVRTELTPELTHILQIPTSGTGLTTQQANMLLEMYTLLGLDPTKPLIVTETSRSAGTINQTIATSATETIVNRV